MTQVKQGKFLYSCKNSENIQAICGHYGYAPHGVYLMNSGDPFWKCGGCGRTVQTANPPDKCPGCGEVFDFKNVTCYSPQFGGPGNIDPQL